MAASILSRSASSMCFLSWVISSTLAGAGGGLTGSWHLMRSSQLEDVHVSSGSTMLTGTTSTCFSTASLNAPYFHGSHLPRLRVPCG